MTHGLEVSRAAADGHAERAVELLTAYRESIVHTDDVAEGLRLFVERCPGLYVGR